ncbi:unnamed protein product [marine sediment metagenome]|uniref:Uncharacterized protein n=1 Tax=marine sediment metagenome TaxID=412755 RepID=X1I8A1_9ZZZZ
MKPEKAIEIKLQWRKDNYPPALADEMNADMLSIEALEFIIKWHDGLIAEGFSPLPGETKE